MVVKLHNWPLSTGYECTGCFRVRVQGLLYFILKVEEMKVKREERKKKWTLLKKNRWKRGKRVTANMRRENMSERAYFYIFCPDEPLPLSGIHWCHFPRPCTLLCKTIFSILQCTLCSVVCLLSAQWQDFWDNFVPCNVQTAVLLPFYLTELTCSQSHYAVLPGCVLSVNW